GVVRFTLSDRLAIGELPEGTSGRVAALAGALAQTGLRAESSDRIQTVEWTKYALFVGGMAVAALTRLETARFLGDPDGARLVVALVREVGGIASGLGISLEDAGLLPIRTLCTESPEEAVARVHRIGAAMAERAPTHKVSTLQDLEAGR